MKKYYLGCTGGYDYQLFRSDHTPVQSEHPEYNHVWGPFKSKAIAEFAQNHADVFCTVGECNKAYNQIKGAK
jgi:hypothetical protein